MRGGSRDGESRYIPKSSSKALIQMLAWEFPLWLSRLRSRHGVSKDAVLIRGLTQWVKDPVLPQAQCRLQLWLGSGVAMAVV